MGGVCLSLRQPAPRGRIPRRLGRAARACRRPGGAVLLAVAVELEELVGGAERRQMDAVAGEIQHHREVTFGQRAVAAGIAGRRAPFSSPRYFI